MNEVGLGSVVQLKCGGPKMTVEAVRDYNCSCVWFTENTETGLSVLNRFVISVAALKVVK